MAVKKDFDMLVAPKLKAEMVLGLRPVKTNRCTLTFSHDEYFPWTGTKEDFKVPILYLPPSASPKRMLSTPHDPVEKSEGEGDSTNEKKRQLIAKIAEASSNSIKTYPMKKSWPASYDDHSARAICENMAQYKIGSCPKAISLEEALRRRTPMKVPEAVASVIKTAANEEDDSDSIRWKRTPGGKVKMHKEDEAITQVFYCARPCAETIDMPPLGTNIIPREQSMQYGPETLA